MAQKEIKTIIICNFNEEHILRQNHSHSRLHLPATITLMERSSRLQAKLFPPSSDTSSIKVASQISSIKIQLSLPGGDSTKPPLGPRTMSFGMFDGRVIPLSQLPSQLKHPEGLVTRVATPHGTSSIICPQARSAECRSCRPHPKRILWNR